MKTVTTATTATLLAVAIAFSDKKRQDLIKKNIG